MKSERVKRLLAGDLLTIRNKIAFHFDEDVLRDGLKQFEGEDQPFLHSWGRERGDIHFSLADALSVAYILDSQADSGEVGHDELGRFRTLLEDVTHFQMAFCEHGEAVVAQGLKELDWVRADIPKSS